MKISLNSLFYAIIVCFFTQCSEDSEVQPSVTLNNEVVQNYANIVSANYQDAYNQAEVMKSAIENFIATPNESNLQKAKEAYAAVRVVYGQTEAYRFYGGPIDDEVVGVEGRINAWPLDESYIDYVEGDNNSGIINDLSITIDKNTLIFLNEAEGETNISLGFHAIEFLLWGQDLYETSAGKRPYTDFVVGIGKNAERRTIYLKIVTQILLEDLATVRNEWLENGSYRKDFVKADFSKGSIFKILTGIAKLGGFELSGERMTVALQNADQEDEHSCFSDLTHLDIIYNLQGIANIYKGTYKKVDGTSIQGKGIKDLIASVNQQESEQVNQLIEDALNKCKAIPQPFDRAIVEADKRPKVQAAIDAILLQTNTLVSSVKKIGYEIIL
jgi:putative iron-regulated protein